MAAAILQHPATPHPLRGSSPQGEPLSTSNSWPRRGQTVGRRKSVKKNAALLHFLAFPSNDHPFGVLRGERLAAHNERRQFASQTRSCGYSPRWGEHCSQPRNPLSRAPRLGSSGTFLLLFWSQKRRNGGGCPLKKALPQGRQGRSGAKILQTTLQPLYNRTNKQNPSKGATK